MSLWRRRQPPAPEAGGRRPALLTCPATAGDGKLHGGSRPLHYRKIDQFLLNYVMGEKSRLAAPVADISSATTTVCVAVKGVDESCR